jgi:enoyl-CoA hydratase
VTDPAAEPRPLVRVERHDAVAVLVLDHPERRNTLTVPMVAAIVAAVAEVEASDASALVVAGAGPAFCGGADLGDLARPEASDADKAASLRAIYEGFLAVARSPLPTVAAVHGPAVGAGLNLALGCDVRIVAESARLVPRFGELGLHPGGGHTWMLHRLGGPQTAAAMTLFGTTVAGPDAARLGLAWACVPDDELLATAVTFAAGAAAAPRELLARMKASLRDVPGLATHAEAVDAELVPQLWSASTPEFAARIAALSQRIKR